MQRGSFDLPVIWDRKRHTKLVGVRHHNMGTLPAGHPAKFLKNFFVLSAARIGEV